jgi:hypothetical protein
MSEYQYYEFLALDRPLTEEQLTELRSLSSRAEITASPACSSASTRQDCLASREARRSAELLDK